MNISARPVSGDRFASRCLYAFRKERTTEHTAARPPRGRTSRQAEKAWRGRAAPLREREDLSFPGAGRLEVDLLGRAHGGLDVQDLDVLPALLGEGGEEVARESDVELELVLGHGGVADGDVQAHDLLELELDGGGELVDLLKEILVRAAAHRELAGTVEARAKKARNKLDEGVGADEAVVLGRELLDELWQGREVVSGWVA